MKQFTIKHSTLRSMEVVDSDGYTITLDSNGQAVTSSEHTAALLARMPRYDVSPEPTPYEALGPRALAGPAARQVAPPVIARQGGTGQNVGDMGLEFDESEQLPNAPIKVVSPKNSPEIPEVVSARLRMLYDNEADLMAIVRGLMDPIDLVTGIVRTLDPRQLVEAHQGAFPDVHKRVQDLERYRSEQEAFTAGLQATIDGLRQELKAATPAPAPTHHHEDKHTAAPAKRK